MAVRIARTYFSSGSEVMGETLDFEESSRQVKFEFSVARIEWKTTTRRLEPCLQRPGTMTVAARSPCRTAFSWKIALPALVRGPILSAAFRWCTNRCQSVVICGRLPDHDVAALRPGRSDLRGSVQHVHL